MITFHHDHLFITLFFRHDCFFIRHHYVVMFTMSYDQLVIMITLSSCSLHLRCPLLHHVYDVTRFEKPRNYLLRELGTSATIFHSQFPLRYLAIQCTAREIIYGRRKHRRQWSRRKYDSKEK
jgi:hypothetical protein